VWGGVVLVACATDPSSGATEAVGQVSSAVFTNGGFETGAAGAAPNGWTVNTFLNNGITVQTPQTYAGLNLAAGGTALTTTIAATNQADPNLGAAASLRVCRYGSQCGRVNFHSSTTYGNGRNVNILAQTMTVASGDVDPADGEIHVRFAIAPVLQNPAHPANEQPYYFVLVNDLTQGTTLYSDFNLSGTAGLAWRKINAGLTTEIDYTDWQLVDVSGAGGAIAQGDHIELRVIGGGCSLGGHFGEVYVDGVGPVIPGLSVEGRGPAQANAGSNITYTLTYENGAPSSAAAETGVVIDVTTPPNTTFQSFTPPTGATCTTPAVGATGTIACTFSGSVASGTSGTFSVTVAIAAGTTGTIVAANYQIQSTQETALIGPPISTLCGCTQDGNCPTGQWCNETSHACTPTVANGGAVPTDGAHSNPTLNGTCTTAAGTLVCTSKVCDTHDNDCGYANGDGPCTAASAATVCRSGACSSNGTCEAAGGCAVDSDCPSSNWCDESTHTCTPKVANGGPVPSDPAHTTPTLDGTCTAAAGAVACASGVCDTDNACGYGDGKGPCTAGDGGASAVCRSGLCASSGSNSGLCVACVGDADCSGGQICGPDNVCGTPAADAGAIDAGSSGAEAGEDAAMEDASGDAEPEDAAEDAPSQDAAADAVPLTDASVAADAAEEPHESAGVDASDSGYIAGGGCSAATGNRPGDARGTFLGGLSAIALLVSRRRRARPPSAR
jgi:hypothetical protein